MHDYNPVKAIENMKIDIPALVHDIKIETHPFQKYIEDFDDVIFLF